MKKATLLLVKILGVAFISAGCIYILAWFPVVDKVANHCEYYPNLTSDCK